MNIRIADLAYQSVITVKIDDNLRYFQNMLTKSASLLNVDYPRFIAVYDSLDILSHRELLENKTPVAVNGIIDDDEDFGIFIPCRHTDEAEAIMLHVQTNERGIRSFTVTTFYPHGLLVGDTKTHLLNDVIERDTNYLISRFTHGSINKHHRRMLDTIGKLDNIRKNVMYIYPAKGTAAKDFDYAPYHGFDETNALKQMCEEIGKVTVTSPTKDLIATDYGIEKYTAAADDDPNDVYCIDANVLEDFMKRIDEKLAQPAADLKLLEMVAAEQKVHNERVNNFMTNVGDALNGIMSKLEHMDAVQRQSTLKLAAEIETLGRSTQRQQGQPQQPSHQTRPYMPYPNQPQPYGAGHVPQQGVNQAQQWGQDVSHFGGPMNTIPGQPFMGIGGQPMMYNSQGQIVPYGSLQQPQHVPRGEYSSADVTQRISDMEELHDLQFAFKGMIARVDELEEMMDDRQVVIEEALENPKPSKAIEADIYRLLRDVRKTMSGEQPQPYNGPVVMNGYSELLQDIVDRIKESNNIPDVKFTDMNEAIEYFFNALETNSDLKTDNNELRLLFKDASERMVNMSKEVRELHQK